MSKANYLKAIEIEYGKLWDYYIRMTDMWEQYTRNYFGLFSVYGAAISASAIIFRDGSVSGIEIEVIFAVVSTVSFVLSVAGLLILGMVVVEITNAQYYHQSIGDFRRYLMEAGGAPEVLTVSSHRTKRNPRWGLAWYFRVHLMCFLNSTAASVGIVSMLIISGHTFEPFANRTYGLLLLLLSGMTFCHLIYCSAIRRLYRNQRGYASIIQKDTSTEADD